MGKEAVVFAEVGKESGEVRAFLESRELILRGDIRRTIALSGISQVRVVDEALIFDHGSESVMLALGAAVSEKWARAMTTPPPDLKTRLGVKPGTRVLFSGQMDDPDLAAALGGVAVDDVDLADMIVARIDRAPDLEGVLLVQSRRPEIPVWAVYPKGAKAAFGDGPIRTRMRDVGFIDSKSCAVSERLTATRYGRRKS